MRNKMELGLLSLAALATGLVLAGPALAATEEIVVEAPRVETMPATAQTGGAQVNLISIRYRVAYADLDLATHSGALALQKRIDDTAAKACKEIDKLYPIGAPSSDKDCVKAAKSSAAAKVTEAIAAAEMKAKK